MHPFFAINRLSAYLDGDLPRQEKLEVEQVLSRHPELEAELLSVQKGVRLLRQVGPVRAPRRLAPEILEAVEARDRSLVRFAHAGRIPQIALFLGVTTIIAAGLAAWMRSAPEPATAADAALLADLGLDEQTLGAADAEDAEDAGDAGDRAPAGDAEAEVDEKEPPPNAIDISTLKDDPEVGLIGSTVSTLPDEPVRTNPGQLTITAVDPEEIDPYVPEWDQNKESIHGEGDAALLQVAVYRLYAKSPNVLQDLHEVAQSYGTVLVDSLGNPLTIRTLDTKEDFASAHLTLPTESIEPFLAQLARLGLAMEISPPESDGETQQVLLEVMHN
jgi:hypothetical protein